MQAILEHAMSSLCELCGAYNSMVAMYLVLSLHPF